VTEEQIAALIEQTERIIALLEEIRDQHKGDEKPPKIGPFLESTRACDQCGSLAVGVVVHPKAPPFTACSICRTVALRMGYRELQECQ
jgi:hypothetical protein